MHDNQCKLVKLMQWFVQPSKVLFLTAIFYFLTVHIAEHSGFKHVEDGMNPEVSDELFNILVGLSQCRAVLETVVDD